VWRIASTPLNLCLAVYLQPERGAGHKAIYSGLVLEEKRLHNSVIHVRRSSGVCKEVDKSDLGLLVQRQPARIVTIESLERTIDIEPGIPAVPCVSNGGVTVRRSAHQDRKKSMYRSTAV
jgi:hypothetical protein